MRSTPSSSRCPPCSSGVKDIRDAVARAEATLAQSGRHTILFVDEVHRFNKAQQDAFLPFVEQGLVTFIGATTENPSFEVDRRAAVARGRLRAGAAVRGGARPAARSRARRRRCRASSIDADARDALIAYADGDGRRLINWSSISATAAGEGRKAPIDVAFVEATIARSPAPLRQGRRGVLRPDLGAAQVGARLQSRCGAVLDVPDARRRRRSALRRAAADPDGERGHRPRGSARAVADARRRRRPTSASARPRASWRSPRR